MISPALRRAAQCELARRDFFYYCRLKAPDFYRPERAFLADFCAQLQAFYASDEEVLVINLPPRHGKSRTIGCFVEWVLGRDQTQKIMTGSYNETLSTTFSKGVRDTISEQKADPEKLVYSDIFPGVSIKRGDGAMNLWSLAGGYYNYLATSPGGTATGFGASLLIIDDLVKSALEANNADLLEKQWRWFTDTMLSRLEEGGKILIVMTRWHTQDLAGRLIEDCRQGGRPARTVIYKALQPDGTMLCPAILSRESYDRKTRLMGPEIAAANYQQEPMDQKGRLYPHFKTYASLPRDSAGRLLFSRILNYTDTADTGDDYLCSINYGVYEGEAYVLGLLYTKDGMELTEPAVAKLLYEGGVNAADIESNNGGRGFARAVERLLRQQYGSTKCVIRPFYQSANKAARILSNSAWVMEHVYYPVNWHDRWPEYFDAMTRYQKEGKNAHDDAPDATTGIAEKVGGGPVYSFD